MLHSALTPKMLAQLQGHLGSLPTFMNSHVFFTHELWQLKLHASCLVGAQLARLPASNGIAEHS